MAASFHVFTLIWFLVEHFFASFVFWYQFCQRWFKNQLTFASSRLIVWYHFLLAHHRVESELEAVSMMSLFSSIFLFITLWCLTKISSKCNQIPFCVIWFDQQSHGLPPISVLTAMCSISRPNHPILVTFFSLTSCIDDAVQVSNRKCCL